MADRPNLGGIQRAQGLGITFQPGHPMGSPYEGSSANIRAAAEIQLKAAEEADKRRRENMKDLQGAFKLYADQAHQKGLERLAAGGSYEGSPTDSVAEKVARTMGHAADGTLNQHKYPGPGQKPTTPYTDPNRVVIDAQGKYHYNTDPDFASNREIKRQKVLQEQQDTAQGARDAARDKARGVPGTGVQTGVTRLRKNEAGQREGFIPGKGWVPVDERGQPTGAAPAAAKPAAAAPRSPEQMRKDAETAGGVTSTAPPVAPKEQPATPGTEEKKTAATQLKDEPALPDSITSQVDEVPGQASPSKLTAENIAEEIAKRSSPEEVQASTESGPYAQPSMFEPGGPLADRPDQPDQPVQQYDTPTVPGVDAPDYSRMEDFSARPNIGGNFDAYGGGQDFGGPLGGPSIGDQPSLFPQESAMDGYDHLFGPQAFDFTPSSQAPGGQDGTSYLPNDSDSFLGSGPLGDAGAEAGAGAGAELSFAGGGGE